MDFLTNTLGYALNWLYQLFNNYGIAIIVFSVVTKLILLPFSIGQQKTMEKSAKVQAKVKEIQERHKGNQEAVNKETMKLYKEEGMNPFSGCLNAILQIVILFSMFFLVSKPLTHMLKLPTEQIQGYITEAKESLPEGENLSGYEEIAVIQKVKPEGQSLINMEFLGIDLSDIPSKNYTNWTVFIIPVLYVITSVVSLRMTNKMQRKAQGKDDKPKEAGKEETTDVAAQMSKNMSFMMPLLSVYIAWIAPLGLGLYWLVNNIMQIVQQVSVSEYLKRAKSKEDNANE